MRVLCVINGLHPGGKERRLVEHLKYLRAHTAVELVLALMSEEMHYPEVLGLGIDVRYVLRAWRRDLRVIGTFYALCREVRPDIIHTWDTMTSALISPVAWLQRIPFLNGMINEAPARVPPFSMTWIRSRISYPFSDLVVGNSLAGLAVYRVPRRKAVCVHNGFDVRRVRNLEDSRTVRTRLGIETPHVVGMVGEFANRKDYPSYLRAARRVLQARDDVTFLAIGGGRMEGECRALVAPEHKARVRFLGWQTHVESIVNILDVGVLATFTEGISNSILEYMALGRPVVATAGGGTDELVVDGATGFLVPSGDDEAIARMIQHLLDRPELAQSMGAAGRERIRNEFSIETMSEHYVSLYERLSGTKPRTPARGS